MKTLEKLTPIAYNAIKEMMMKNLIIPGQRIIFSDIAQKLGISRTPVNNALSILANEGYLEYAPNRGYSVRSLTKKELEDLFEAREALEIGSIAKAIRSMSHRDCTTLEIIKKAIEDAIVNWLPRSIYMFDIEFHCGIIGLTGNGYLVQRYTEVSQMIFLNIINIDPPPMHFEKIIQEHYLLLEAMRGKNVDYAKSAIQKHNTNEKRYAVTAAIRKGAGLKSLLKTSLPN